MIKIRDLAKISNKRIEDIESALGKENIRNLLKSLLKKGFMCNDIGKMFKKDRHVLHQWIKRYGLKAKKYTGFKKSIIKLTFNKDEHDVNHGRYENIKGKEYKVFYVYPSELFAYSVGLILGDGHPEDCNVYITGGKPYNFLDNIISQLNSFGKYLGDKSVIVKYYNKNDKILDRDDPNVSYWRIYIYWSALSHSIKNKNILSDMLKTLWIKKKIFNSFIAGLFDADGYFVYKNNKPERIGIDQTEEKWWFPLLCKNLQSKYNSKFKKRVREYRFKNRNKLYEGTSTSNIITFKQSSWGNFVNDIITPFSNKPRHLERAPIFVEHSLKMKNRWRL